MAELLLENTKRLEEMPSRTKRLAYPLYSSVCAIAMMSGLVFADIIANELFLVVVLCLSIILRLSRYLLRQYSHFGFILILAFYAGGFASFIEQYRYDRPLITEVNDLEITGKIDKLEQQTEERWRLWLVDIDAPDNFEPRLHKIRLVIDFKEDTTPRKGDLINASVRLFPLSGPLFLGWPDYSRKAWSEGIDATGYARYATLIKSTDYEAGFLETIRQNLLSKIDEDLSKQPAVIAKALLLGIRDRRDVELWSDFRKAGLSHLLAISGLHMGLFCFGVYLIIRVILATDLKTAAYFPHHKLAAIIALFSGLFYLMLAHHPISAIRAYMMAVVILMAILSDRRTVTLRNLNIIFMLFLLSAPSSLYQPSFQLSFAATYGIIMLYDSPVRPALMKMAIMPRMIGFLCLTSFAAITATFPISAYHFGSFSIWGLLANIMAIPLTAMVIMPLAVCFLILSIFQAQFLIAPLFDFVLSLLITVAHEVATLPFSDISIKMPTAPLLFALIIVFTSAYLVKHPIRLAILALIVPIIFAWSEKDIPIAMAELRGDKIAFAMINAPSESKKTLYHSFRLSSFWENSLHKLFVSFDSKQAVNCYFGCEIGWSNTQFVIHNYRYTQQISCKSRAVHLLTAKPNLDHCKDTPIYFVVDNSAHKYLLFRRGDEFFFQPQKRAPLHKAWRP